MEVIGTIGNWELLLVLLYLIGFGIAVVIPISILVLVCKTHKQLMEISKAIENLAGINNDV